MINVPITFMCECQNQVARNIWFAEASVWTEEATVIDFGKRVFNFKGEAGSLISTSLNALINILCR